MSDLSLVSRPPRTPLRARRLLRTSDLALDSDALAWLRRLPPGRQPLRLAKRFPRLVNRIAWCWADAALADQVFDDLLTDRRGGRQGFPVDVVQELRRLRAHRAALGAGASGGNRTHI